MQTIRKVVDISHGRQGIFHEFLSITLGRLLMTWLYWILLIINGLFLIIAWLLLARMVLVVDTEKGIYCFNWQGVASARITTDGNVLLWCLGWRKSMPLAQLFNQPSPEKARPEQKKKKRRSLKISFRTALRKGTAVLRSFRVRQLNCRLDTDNYLTNAYLYPVLGLLSGPGRRLEVNFNGELALQLEIENRLYRIVLAFLS